MKKVLISALIVLGISFSCLFYTWQKYQNFLDLPLRIGANGAMLYVEPGMSGRSVVIRLSELGISDDNWQWRLLLRMEPTVFKTGEYQLHAGMLPRNLLLKLEQGDVIRYRFTLVEGWSYRQLMAALQADPVLGPQLLTKLQTETWQQPATAWDHPEGAFLPETYVFTRADNASNILMRASQAMQSALAEAWAEREQNHPLQTPYELLILASIIEKETALEEERTQISGVFVRRLKLGMRLQTDPTVIYGLGDAYDGDIRRRDLHTDTPYNTYTRKGLPPTPIAMPGRASLLAAAQPAQGDALYFVANGKGGHTFSATLEQHQQAVNRLLGRK